MSDILTSVGNKIVCTYKDCGHKGVDACGSDAWLCVEHAREWHDVVENPEAPVKKVLGALARSTHKVRDEQCRRILGL